MKTDFTSLGLSAETLRALAAAGYEAPTAIQTSAIPPALAGKNVIGCAATGTGKTAAFMLPLIERTAGKRGTRALVLAPTRELAEQIAEYVETFGEPRGVKAAVCVGGLGMGPQAAALRERRPIVIATPGRLIDHLGQGTADLSGVETLVLDEADRMLDMGFRPQLEKIFARMPRKRQTLLFSATMAGEVSKFASSHVPDPVRIEVHRSGTTAARAEQTIYRVDRNEKAPLLLALLSDDEDSTLVFVRTKHRADKIARIVEQAGHKASRIHGDRTQSQRKQALAGFKDGRYRILVATDVAARGIDVEEIGHVINFDLPGEPEDYIHRIGRTARNAASGRATSFAEADETPELLAIERLIGSQIPRAAIPRTHEVFAAEVEKRQARERDPGVHGGRTRAQRGEATEEPTRTEAQPVAQRRQRPPSRGPRPQGAAQGGMKPPRRPGDVGGAKDGPQPEDGRPARRPRSFGSGRPGSRQAAGGGGGGRRGAPSMPRHSPRGR